MCVQVMGVRDAAEWALVGEGDCLIGEGLTSLISDTLTEVSVATKVTP